MQILNSTRGFLTAYTGCIFLRLLHRLTAAAVCALVSDD